MVEDEDPTVCPHCGEGPTVVDPDTSFLICSSCGRQLSPDDDFQCQIFTADGVRQYNLVSDTDFSYQERKTYRAKTLISDVTSRLGLSSAAAEETLALIADLTENSFGDGEWLFVLAAAAAYVVLRRRSIPLSLPDAAAAAGCEPRQVSRMVSRIVRFRGSGQLPEFDITHYLSNTIRSFPRFAETDSDRVETMVGMGEFLIRCAVKWFLATGRRPMPLVAAVAAFVAEVHGMDAPVEEFARQVHAAASTSKLRLKELKETLIKVARNVLPWGKDVDLKNLAQNAPLLIRCMEMKAKSNPDASSENWGLDFDGVSGMSLNTDEEGSGYFRAGVPQEGISWDELRKVKITESSLAIAYKNVLERIDRLRESGGLSSNEGRTKKRRMEGLEMDGWDYDKNLTLEEVMERDVGYDALPPSFINGLESRARRKAKMKAAKVRIDRIMKPMAKTDSVVVVEEGEGLSEQLATRKTRRKRKGVGVDGIDWEDCIIELLLLHRVDEDEIEQGQYNRLLDLHVFNSLDT